MKYYETHYEEYIQSVKKYNIHPELLPLYSNMPNNIFDFENLIVYGPVGVCKYSQVLFLLEKYSPSNLKYEKKIQIYNEKQSYNYKISDIHYEIDMSFLGCNSKILWHEIFLQIIDIISVKQNKIGIILCKNFHLIHNELLEVFYSYIQEYNNPHTTIQLKFIILTEHISFIPNNILNSCEIISIGRPSNYVEIANNHSSNTIYDIIDASLNNKSSQFKYIEVDKLLKTQNIIKNINSQNIVNGKEIKSFSLIKNVDELPEDIFNIICNNIIEKMNNHTEIIFTSFRDTLYDILVYNLDVSDCIWYILSYYIQSGKLEHNDISDILIKLYSYFKYYNNNYRPIYHLESIFFYMIIKIHKIKM